MSIVPSGETLSTQNVVKDSISASGFLFVAQVSGKMSVGRNKFPIRTYKKSILKITSFYVAVGVKGMVVG